MKEINLTPEEAVRLFRDKGLIGAGGAGFPTYFKYNTPTKTLIVNCEEGEPGYEADKLLLISQAEKFVQIFEALKKIFGFETILIGAKEKDKDKLDPLAEKYGFEVRYSPSLYGMGEERWLTKAVTGVEIPADKIPPQLGFTVNNVETVYNMYRALFEDTPVVDKYFNVYGEVAEPKVFCAPVGSYVIDILGLVGIDTTRSHNLTVIDGGPMMGDLICGQAKRITDEGLVTEDRPLAQQSVTKKTNGLLVVDRSLYTADQAAFKHLPDKEPPAWEDTLPEIMEKLGLERYLDWHPRPEEIVYAQDEVKRVRIAMKQGPLGRPSVPCVEEGQKVKRGERIAQPVSEDVKDFQALSVSHHASIDGVVTEVTPDHVCIERT